MVIHVKELFNVSTCFFKGSHFLDKSLTWNIKYGFCIMTSILIWTVCHICWPVPQKPHSLVKRDCLWIRKLHQFKILPYPWLSSILSQHIQTNSFIFKHTTIFLQWNISFKELFISWKILYFTSSIQFLIVLAFIFYLKTSLDRLASIESLVVIFNSKICFILKISSIGKSKPKIWDIFV